MPRCFYGSPTNYVDLEELEPISNIPKASSNPTSIHGVSICEIENSENILFCSASPGNADTKNTDSGSSDTIEQV
jgi:hypothetical protein